MKDWNIVEQHGSTALKKRNSYKVTYSKRFWYNGYRLSSTIKKSKSRVPKGRKML